VALNVDRSDGHKVDWCTGRGAGTQSGKLEAPDGQPGASADVTVPFQCGGERKPQSRVGRCIKAGDHAAPLDSARR